MGNVIEINGKKYDAVTGKLIRGSGHKSQKSTIAARSSMDGVVSKKQAQPRARRKVQPASSHTSKTTQKSRTLMRSAVKKPTTKKTTTKAAIKKSQLGVSKKRAEQASSVRKSPLVAKFSSTQSEPRPVVKKITHMPVKKQTKPAAAKTRTAAANKVGKAASAAAVSKKNVAAAKMIEAALAKADAHEQPHHAAPKKRSRISHKLGVSARAMTVSAALLSAVLFGGFIALQNIPNISMRVAAARAGFDATLPGYSPSGFSFNGPINYSSGQVTISFKSKTDDRQYQVVQRASNWNSDALLNNFVAIDGGDYQTLEDRGRTLYIYNGSNATWIDNGIWYQIEGTSRMSTDQLIRVAASM